VGRLIFRRRYTYLSFWTASQEAGTPRIESCSIGAGRILVLERGRLVEQGTHDEVMEPQGLYVYLASQQLEL
jgi:hypothetical protein